MRKLHCERLCGVSGVSAGGIPCRRLPRRSPLPSLLFPHNSALRTPNYTRKAFHMESRCPACRLGYLTLEAPGRGAPMLTREEESAHASAHFYRRCCSLQANQLVELLSSLLPIVTRSANSRAAEQCSVSSHPGLRCGRRLFPRHRHGLFSE